MLFGIWRNATKTMRWLIRIGAAVVLFAFVTTMTMEAQTKPLRPQITGLTFVSIGVENMESAVRFYHQELSLPYATCQFPDAPAKCFFINPDQRVNIMKNTDSANHNLIQATGWSTSNATALRMYLIAHGQKPGDITTDSQATISFQIRDPEDHVIEFSQRTGGIAGSIKGGLAISNRTIHAGFIVKDRVAMDKFYKDILGFHLYWSGGMKDGETNWVSMQVPDGTDWIEYMLNVDPNADQHLRGVMNHMALGVSSVKEAAIQLEKNGVKLPEQPKIGRDGKWQLNLYDPDQTRVELMEFTPVEKPCCSEFTGTHPKP